jgi:predicted DCC family thiol-disulfide oxidoreductase YuxK
MEKLKIYYDGLCRVCEKEILHYKKVDTHNRLAFIDITLDSFDASEHGLNRQLVQKYFHVKNKDGEIISGVGAFNLIWKELEVFYPLQVLYKMPLSKQAMQLGYCLFAQVRPYLPKKEKCDDGTCDFR